MQPQIVRIVPKVQRIRVRRIHQTVRVVSGVGRRGPAGTGTGALTIEKTADGALSGHRIVRSVDAARVGYVDATDLTNGDDVLGMTLGAASDGGTVNVLVEGEVTEPSWNWTPLEPIYVTGLGMLTQTTPDDMAFILQIGYALSATAARISLRDTIYL